MLSLGLNRVYRAVEGEGELAPVEVPRLRLTADAGRLPIAFRGDPLVLTGSDR